MNVSQRLVFEENSYNTPICDVCLRKIDESIHRLVIFQDNEKNPKVKRFHFFFPCWDMNHICQNYTNQKIIRVGFSCESDILNNEKIKKLQKNFSLWE
jgi:hypothetical protein